MCVSVRLLFKSITEMIRGQRLCWYGHAEKMGKDHYLAMARKILVHGKNIVKPKKLIELKINYITKTKLFGVDSQNRDL